jgi:hypothetical protein
MERDHWAVGWIFAPKLPHNNTPLLSLENRPGRVGDWGRSLVRYVSPATHLESQDIRTLMGLWV